MANVFISYRTVDHAAAERLAHDLQQRGHRVWLDTWRIDLGDSIVGCINEGLEGADYVVLCYSDAGVTSPWMAREWMSTLAQQLDGRAVKLLPVRLTGGASPAILKDIKYADLARNWEIGLMDLLRALR